MNKKQIGTIAAVIVLLGGVGAFAAYNAHETQLANTAKVHPQKIAAAQPQQPAQPACDDKNIVGTVAGGVAGGVVGNQFGKGGGKTAATIGGVVGGAFLGNQYIPTRNVTCR